MRLNDLERYADGMAIGKTYRIDGRSMELTSLHGRFARFTDIHGYRECWQYIDLMKMGVGTWNISTG